MIGTLSTLLGAAEQLAAADPAGVRKGWGGLPARMRDNEACDA
jgi:hypothetical protein